MKNLIQAVVVAAALAAPVAVFAQSSAPLTRAQVRAELIELEKAGYNPAVGEDPHYPEDLQAAEARVEQQHALARTQGVDNSGIGKDAQGAVASGKPAKVVAPRANDEMKSLYRGH
ncbi:DUF4148 domain-containing protein [Burkholderia sp. JP2-270]|uniref:DUF4148 domain-containing protein n=1 Tax=Burkholderia sp. JP2-270 TaxID=2217913 RepID=UPI000DA26A57|nr:DUF4148 domain-containing protein [Burkholderia sp. JP2-270]AWV02916.1 DUF4148 domain-containing protein [Burkholderia sp. JP2-270]